MVLGLRDKSHLLLFLQNCYIYISGPFGHNITFILRYHSGRLAISTAWLIVSSRVIFVFSSFSSPYGPRENYTGVHSI